MDVLALCWIFDKRWMFGVNCKLHLALVPIALNILSIAIFALSDNE